MVPGLVGNGFAVRDRCMIVLIEASQLPGRRYGPNADGKWYENVHVGLCRGPKAMEMDVVMPKRPWSVPDQVVGDAPWAHWEFEVPTRDSGNGIDFAGPFARGPRIDRHIGLAWGDVPGDGTFRLFRCAKLRFSDIPVRILKDALLPGRRLVGRLRLTDPTGNPRCARVRPPDIAWSAEPTSAIALQWSRPTAI